MNPVFIELNITVADPEGFIKDLLMDALAELEYDTFEENETGFCAYVTGDKFDKAETESLLSEMKEEYDLSYRFAEIPYENWNKIWESNFQPVVIAGKCQIRASFHEPRPDLPMEIIIDPKMAFGTGHHETTSLVSAYLFEINCQGKTVLDMGCGTAILAILAEKLGASAITAIDNDAQAIENAKECIALNNCNKILAFTGDRSSLIQVEPVALLLANINRNILLDQLPEYARLLLPGGCLIMSGFYAGADLQQIRAKAEQLGLNYIDHQEKNNWVAARFKK